MLKPTIVNVDEPIIFEVEVEGVPKPKIYWFCEKRKLHETRNVRMREEEIVDEKTNKTNLVKCTLEIDQAKEVDSGKYTVRAINRAGVKSSSVNLTVKGDYLFDFFTNYIHSLLLASLVLENVNTIMYINTHRSNTFALINIY